MADRQRAHATLTTGESPARIVVAANNADLREYLQCLLSERYTVEALPDGATALAAVQCQLPALVLSDEMMPVLDGFRLLWAVRADPHTRAVPVIFLSARSGEDATVERLEAGADDCLLKPFSARELLSRIAVRLKSAALYYDAQTYARLLEATLDSVMDPIVAYDSDGRILASNTAFRESLARFSPRNQLDTARERAKQVPFLDCNGALLPEAHWPLTRILRSETIGATEAIDLMRRTPTGQEFYFRAFFQYLD